MYQIYSEGLEIPKLTASFLDFLLEELGVDFWDTPRPWGAASAWADAGWVISEGFKEAGELSCALALGPWGGPGWLVWSEVAWEVLGASFFSKFFLFAILFLVTFEE